MTPMFHTQIATIFFKLFFKGMCSFLASLLIRLLSILRQCFDFMRRTDPIIIIVIRFSKPSVRAEPAEGQDRPSGGGGN